MAHRSSAAATAAAIPDATQVERVAAFAREPFVLEGEDREAALAPGTLRRAAFDRAQAELDGGAAAPTQKWRRRWSMLLGLERVLASDEPHLLDGTVLGAHQVDALSGTHIALVADALRRTGIVTDPDAEGDEDGVGPVLAVDEAVAPREDAARPAAASAGDDDEQDEASEDEDDDGEDDFSPLAEDDELRDIVGDDDDEDDDEDDDDSDDADESEDYDSEDDADVDEDLVDVDDPNAHKRFWFEHATGAGKTVAAVGFAEASRTGGTLILTHRRNLVDQFVGELSERGYAERICEPLLGDEDRADGPVTVETYQWFVRNAGQISGAYTTVICDEAHTALGDKTSAAIREWTGPIFIGMTATGALIARHVTDLFPTQTSRFDLAQAARRGVIAPLRALRIPPGTGVRSIAKVPLRKGEVDMEFDQEELAELLDQAPFNLAIADLYKWRFNGVPGVVYAAGVKHAHNVAEAFRQFDIKAEAVSGETPKRELTEVLARYERGEVDVLVNAQLLAEGWNSPRATVCLHLAPTASKRIYQQRVGRVTRRQAGKESGIVVDFVHPATTHDDPVVTLHSLLDRDVYRGGAIVVGPVKRGRGRRVKVERRVIPVTPDIERRKQVFERELWRIAVEQLDWGEQKIWAMLAGAKASTANWRRARTMLAFERSGELRRTFLAAALERNRNPQLRVRAVQEIAQARDPEAFDLAVDQAGQWPRDERREASRMLLQALAERRIGRRDQATAWIWRLASWTRDLHEEYAAQRWPETKHLLGLLVNSSGHAHARNARRIVHQARQHDRRLQAALLAAAVAHTPEAEEVLREARTRLARKPGALSRELLRNFPKGKKKRRKKRRGKGGDEGPGGDEQMQAVAGQHGDGTNGGGANGGGRPDGGGSNGGGGTDDGAADAGGAGGGAEGSDRAGGEAQGSGDGLGSGTGQGGGSSRSSRRRRSRRRGRGGAGGAADGSAEDDGGSDPANGSRPETQDDDGDGASGDGDGDREGSPGEGGGRGSRTRSGRRRSRGRRGRGRSGGGEAGRDGEDAGGGATATAEAPGDQD